MPADRNRFVAICTSLSHLELLRERLGNPWTGAY